MDVEELETEIKRRKKREKDLENNLKIICQSPFFNNPDSQISNIQKLKNTELKITETRAAIAAEKTMHNALEDQRANLQRRNENLEKELAEIEDQLIEVTTLIGEEEKYRNRRGSPTKKNISQLQSSQFSKKEDQLQVSSTFNENGLEKSKLVYFGDDFANKPQLELQRLGIEKSTQEGEGWYKVKLLERELTSTMDQKALLKEIQRLVLENGELASHLEKSVTMINIHKDMEDDRREAQKLELDILDAKIQEKNNSINEIKLKLDQKMESGAVEDVGEVEYDDQVDYFEESQVFDRRSRPETENIFDLHLSEVELDQHQIQEILKTKGLHNLGTSTLMKIVILISFYDHDLVSTPVYTGAVFECDFQATFNVVIEKRFLDYCFNSEMKLDVYGIMGESRFKLGEGKLPLAELIKRNAENLEYKRNLVAVIKGRYEIDNNLVGFPIGQFSAQYRLRQPCGVPCKVYLSEQVPTDMQASRLSRKLVIEITNGQGFPKSSRSFISYDLFNSNETFVTKIGSGNRPKYEYTRSHNILFTPELKKKFEREMIEFVAYDDTQPVQEEMEDPPVFKDLLGIGRLNLKQLVQGSVFDDTLLLTHPKYDSSCYIKLRIYFYDFKGKIIMKIFITSLV